MSIYSIGHFIQDDTLCCDCQREDQELQASAYNPHLNICDECEEEREGLRLSELDSHEDGPIDGYDF